VNRGNISNIRNKGGRRHESKGPMPNGTYFISTGLDTQTSDHRPVDYASCEGMMTQCLELTLLVAKYVIKKQINEEMLGQRVNGSDTAVEEAFTKAASTSSVLGETQSDCGTSHSS